jgi:negative regulator of sigma-B (phosphoserine phosphatase)
MKSGAFSRPFKGLTVCGDSFVIVENNGTFLAAVIDGLGHGFESWVAAEKAVEVIRGNLDLPVEPILMRCHKELRATRGAAVGILKVEEDGAGQFCGVGNIEVQALSGSAPSLFCLAGIVGHNLRTSRVMSFQMKPGDVYCVMSDGVSSRGNFKTCLPGTPTDVARRIVEQWGRDHDDATALIMGYQADSLLGGEQAGQ